mgnify:CR=1 FL=1
MTTAATRGRSSQRRGSQWEQVIDAEEGQVMPAEVLSGNLIVDTFFCVKGVAFAQQKYRVFYV